MLLEFSVENYRSINERCTLSMAARGILDEPKDNVVEIGNNKILKTAAIYGANSSGKSNVVNAMNVMKAIVVNSIRLNDGDSLKYDPFMLSMQRNQPSFFEVIFVQSNYKYRYGFELTSEKIISEWLFKSTLKRRAEKKLFTRSLDNFDIDDKKFKEGIGKSEMVNNNRLFISLCGQLGGKESKIITKWFSEVFEVISGLNGVGYGNFTTSMLHEELEGYTEAKEFLSKIKLGFQDINTKEIEFDISHLPKDMPDKLKQQLATTFKGENSIKIYTLHNVYNDNGSIADTRQFNFMKMESEGTKKVVELSGPIFDTLKKGYILVVDELDAKLHPIITQQVIRLFNNPETNPNNAQLIFNTHDTHLLSSKLLRRDQIWFTEKDEKEQTDLYSLVDFILPDGNKPRNDANYEKNYIAGRYGAIPYILNF